jgi:urease accessory protein
MSVGISQFNTQPSYNPASLHSIRAQGRLSARFARIDKRTLLADLRESGGYRLKFPRGSACEAVIVNTGGGVAGGDDLSFDFTAENSASVTLTSQAAEKLYRSQGKPITASIHLRAEPGATIEWLPQETILFDGAQFDRTFTLDLAANANALIFESLVLGRLAMGEEIATGSVHDHWRVRQGGRLIFADEVRFEEPLPHLLSRPATFAGAKAIATLVLIRHDAVEMRDAVRPMQWDGVEMGVSIVNGLFIARFLAHDPLALRKAARDMIETLRGAPLPRVFTF